jgi:ubiquinone biosynthesis UbiH/UbiF/VisC/COQ6 family hydroxylase
MVVDGKPVPVDMDHTDDDPPTTALSAASVRMLQSMGAWESLVSCAAPILSIYTRKLGAKQGASVPLKIDAGDAYAGMPNTPEARFQLNEQDALGAVVATPRLVAALIARAKSNGHVDWHAPAQVENVAPTRGKGYMAQLSHDRIQADLLVIADGPHSALRKQIGIDAERLDYGRSALLVNMNTQGLAAGAAHELFLKDGSMALLPIFAADGSERALIVRVGAHDAIEHMQKMSDEDLSETLSDTLGISGVRLYHPGTRRVRPLSMIWAKEQYRRGVVLIGDAAHGLHPIAAQGFNLSAGDISCLTGVLRDAAIAGRPLGSVSVLAHYMRERERAQAKARLLSDGLARFLTADHPLTSGLGELGFSVLRYAGPLRRYFIRRAMA